jgi:two-component system cell cycle response regulator DivK
MSLPSLVLLVDDFTDTREMNAEFLAFSGLRVVQADSGEEALRLTHVDPPALIVLDLSLPGIDGWETLRRLRSTPVTRAIPVIVLSGHDTEPDRVRARELGCQAYLVKPCHPDDLVREVTARIAR